MHFKMKRYLLLNGGMNFIGLKMEIPLAFLKFGMQGGFLICGIGMLSEVRNAPVKVHNVCL